MSKSEAPSVSGAVIAPPLADRTVGDVMNPGIVSCHQDATIGSVARIMATHLLVVGSRSYGPLGRLMHGSTSQQLARTCRCALLVLPRAMPQPETGVSGSLTATSS